VRSKIKVAEIMRIVIIILAAILAAISWLKPDKPIKWLAYTCVAIILLTAILEIANQRKERRGKAKEQFTGILHPKSKILVSSDLKNLPKIEIADTGSTIEMGSGKNQDFLDRLLKENNFTLEVEKGQIKITLLIRDRTGKAVAEIVKNEWKVNPNSSFDRNFSKNALEVKDLSGEIIIQVRLIEDRIQLQGKFYHPDGSGVEIGILSKDKNYPGGIHFLGPDTPSTLKIEPIFVYPSDQHLGELRKKH
jgi:hypothetical protein